MLYVWSDAPLPLLTQTQAQEIPKLSHSKHFARKLFFRQFLSLPKILVDPSSTIIVLINYFSFDYINTLTDKKNNFTKLLLH